MHLQSLYNCHSGLTLPNLIDPSLLPDARYLLTIGTKGKERKLQKETRNDLEKSQSLRSKRFEQRYRRGWSMSHVPIQVASLDHWVASSWLGAFVVSAFCTERGGSRIPWEWWHQIQREQFEKAHPSGWFPKTSWRWDEIMEELVLRSQDCRRSRGRDTTSGRKVPLRGMPEYHSGSSWWWHCKRVVSVSYLCDTIASRALLVIRMRSIYGMDTIRLLLLHPTKGLNQIFLQDASEEIRLCAIALDYWAGGERQIHLIQ